jgi:hypothetical protein
MSAITRQKGSVLRRLPPRPPPTPPSLSPSQLPPQSHLQQSQPPLSQLQHSQPPQSTQSLHPSSSQPLHFSQPSPSDGEITGPDPLLLSVTAEREIVFRSSPELIGNHTKIKPRPRPSPHAPLKPPQREPPSIPVIPLPLPTQVLPPPPPSMAKRSRNASSVYIPSDALRVTPNASPRGEGEGDAPSQYDIAESIKSPRKSRLIRDQQARSVLIRLVTSTPSILLPSRENDSQSPHNSTSSPPQQRNPRRCVPTVSLSHLSQLSPRKTSTTNSPTNERRSSLSLGNSQNTNISDKRWESFTPSPL